MIAALAFASLVADAPAPPVPWLRAHAVRAGEDPPGPAEAAALKDLVTGARVLGIGEPAHTAHEPLVERNRLIRTLVQHHGFTAVALESGLAQTRRVDAYIQGDPGDAATIAHEGLSWTFGDLTSNVALITWLRAWNADPKHHRVHLYGADISGGDPVDSLAGARLALDDVLAFLAGTAPARSAELRARLTPFAPRFTPEAYATYSPADRAALARALADVAGLLEAERSAMVAASSPDAYAWAVREAVDAERLQAVFAVWPAPGADQFAAGIAVSNIRDKAMADHLLWALAREGPSGRIIAFAANGHVATASLLPARFDGLSALGSMGMNLRAAVGSAYRVMLQLSPANGSGAPADKGAVGSVEAALLAVGVPRLFVDIRHAEPSDWWGRTQTVRSHFTGKSNTVPARAADALMLIGPLTCDPTTRAAKNECHGK